MPERAFSSSKTNNQYAGIVSLPVLPRQHIKQMSQHAPATRTWISSNCLEFNKTEGEGKRNIEELVKIWLPGSGGDTCPLNSKMNQSLRDTGFLSLLTLGFCSLRVTCPQGAAAPPVHSNICLSLGETLGTDMSSGFPLLHFPCSGIFLRLLKAHCGFVSCHVWAAEGAEMVWKYIRWGPYAQRCSYCSAGSWI